MDDSWPGPPFGNFRLVGRDDDVGLFKYKSSLK
jgi:hypothetical protein